MKGAVVFLLLSSQHCFVMAAVDKGNDTEVVDRPTLSTEISRAVTDCTYPDSAGNRSYSDLYNASHHLPTTTEGRGHGAGSGTPPTSRPGSQGQDSELEEGDTRPKKLRWDSFLRDRRDDNPPRRGGRRRGRRSTYDSRSTSLPACTVQCVFTRLDAVDDMGYVTEAGVLALLDNYVIDRNDRRYRSRRVVACFRKLGSAVEDDHCAHARKMALCFALDFKQRTSTSRQNGTSQPSVSAILS